MIFIWTLLISIMVGILSGWFFSRRLQRKPILCIGDIVVIKSEDKTTLSLEVDDLFEKIEHQKEISLKVRVSEESVEGP